MNDDFLNRYRRAPRPEFAARLYERIAIPMLNQPKRAAGRRAWLTASTLLAGVCGVMLLFPPARAFADGIWHQIGGYVFVQSAPEPIITKGAQPAAEQANADATKAALIKAQGQATPAEGNKPAAISAAEANKPAPISAAEASRQVGFTVLVPSYVPAGYEAGPGFVVDNRTEGQTAMGIYIGADHHNAIKLVEFKLAAGQAPLTYYWPDAKDVTVRGLPGLLRPGETQTLVWEEKGITISLLGEGPGLDELMKMAEGLR